MMSEITITHFFVIIIMKALSSVYPSDVRVEGTNIWNVTAHFVSNCSLHLPPFFLSRLFWVSTHSHSCTSVPCAICTGGQKISSYHNVWSYLHFSDFLHLRKFHPKDHQAQALQPSTLEAHIFHKHNQPVLQHSFALPTNCKGKTKRTLLEGCMTPKMLIYHN